MNDIHISKFLSYVLRHQPDAIGLSLDAQGWTSMDDLIAKAAAAGTRLTREAIGRVVRQSDKQRFALSEDGLQIRANQGHSVDVDLALADRQPPDILFHGTATRVLDAILREGLKAQARHAVHLSSTRDTAHRVGRRHGSPVVLLVRAAELARDGHRFQCSENGVWLTAEVPPRYLVVDEGDESHSLASGHHSP